LRARATHKTSKDPVADWVHASRLLQSNSYLPNFTLETLGGAHWVHVERPDEVNAIIRKWLDSTFPRHEVGQAEETQESVRRAVDEL